MEITDIEDGDVEAVVAMWDRCGLLVPWNDPRKDIALCRAHANSTVLVGKIDGLVRAAAMVGHDGHRGYVYYVAVDPDCQGRGLGREMIEAATAWLTERSVPKLQFMIRPDNDKVRGFYESLGFAEKPFILMQKWLIPPETD
jgi:ribosomal protein S18 acetylase RimI-like enzyme